MVVGLGRFYGRSLGILHLERASYVHGIGLILFANHMANGVVTNLGLLANTVDVTGKYMAG